MKSPTRTIVICVLILAFVWTWNALTEDAMAATVNLAVCFAAVIAYNVVAALWRVRLKPWMAKRRAA